MSFTEVMLIAFGLAMDAFAVSVCKGLAMKHITPLNALTVGLWFGGFQALMPLLGYFLGSRFNAYIEKYDHWIAFALLLLIGLNMVREAVFGGEEENAADASVSPKSMLLPAIATSIDALAVGVAFGVVAGGGLSIWQAVAVIGGVTLIVSALGVKIGSVFGSRYKRASEVTGGLILVVIGVKIVLEHSGFLA